ncbi:MAG: phosphopantothenate/pantothenate synthetase [Crenarchaeota archaeon]|nr:phosphopantothenate/pantothenate synthetase [Thermoproteota archaeon]
MGGVSIPFGHPRRGSLLVRERLVEGFLDGYVVPQGLIAHGRGECFDYLIGEVSIGPAVEAMRAGVALLLLSERPVISVNGNVAALAAEHVVELAREVDAVIEVNLFYRSRERIERIRDVFKKLGVEVLGTDERYECTIPELFSERRKVDCRGIYVADTVLVAVEDGDRTEALKKVGKKVIAIDLNPLSRTALTADITIVDNIVRALPRMVQIARELKKLERSELEKIVSSFDNRRNISLVLDHICSRLREIASSLLMYKSEK